MCTSARTTTYPLGRKLVCTAENAAVKMKLTYTRWSHPAAAIIHHRENGTDNTAIVSRTKPNALDFQRETSRVACASCQPMQVIRLQVPQEIRRTGL